MLFDMTELSQNVMSLPAGSKTWVRQKFAAADGRECVVSVGVIRGAKPGRVFANVAGQHGMEHTGPMILRDLFDEIDPANLAGTLLLCPCANPLALKSNFEVYPENEKLVDIDKQDLTSSMFNFQSREQLGAYNLNRVWADDIATVEPAGLAGRIAHWLWRTMIAHADVVVDHHSVKRSLKPYVFCEDPMTGWAPVLGFEGIWSTGPLPPEPTPYVYQRLALQSIRHGKVGLVIEYSRQYEIAESELSIGRFAVMNMMRALGMLPGKVEVPRPVWLLKGPYYNHLTVAEATAIGHVHFRVGEYEAISKGQRVAEVRDIDTHEIVQVVDALFDGLLLHRTPRPFVRPGDWICRMTQEATLVAKPGEAFEVPPLPSAR